MFVSPLKIWPGTVLTIKSNWSLTFSNTIAVTTCNEKQSVEFIVLIYNLISFRELTDATIVDELNITPPSVVETEFVPGSIHSERVREV